MFAKIENAVTGKGYRRHRTLGARIVIKKWRSGGTGKTKCSLVPVGIVKNYQPLRNEERAKKAILIRRKLDHFSRIKIIVGLSILHLQMRWLS